MSVARSVAKRAPASPAPRGLEPTPQRGDKPPTGTEGAWGDGDPARSAESSKWKLREKHFFVISIPGGPMEVFASADLDDVTDWVGALRRRAWAHPIGPCSRGSSRTNITVI